MKVESVVFRMRGVIGQVICTFHVSFDLKLYCLTIFFILGSINDSLLELQHTITKILKDFIGLELNCFDKSHISLTRTVVLQHHWIDIFKTSIIEQLKDVRSKTIDLNSLMFYTNDEKTRTFIGISVILKSDMLYLNDLVRRMNICLGDFNLPPYYEVFILIS